MPLIDSLISYYPCDESSGTTISDIVGTNDLEATGLTLGGVGKINNGLSADGAGDRATVATTGIHSFPTSSFTINLWIDYDTTHEATVHAVGFGGPGISQYELVVDDAGNEDKLNFNLLSSTPTTSSLQTGNLGFDSSKYSMITILWDRANRKQRMYVDAVEIAASPKTLAAEFDTLNTSTDKWTICGNNSGGGPYKGLMDEIGVWDRALSPTEITQLYNDGAALPFANFNSIIPTLVGVMVI